MTSRERILAAIDHRIVDRLPMDYWGTPEATRKLQRALGAETEADLWKRLDLDKIQNVGARYIGPPLRQEGDIRYDFWGSGYRSISYDSTGSSYSELCRYPLEGLETVDEIEAAYDWPRVDWFDLSGIPKAIADCDGYAVECGYIAPFYMYANIRGLEQTLVDLASNGEVAHYIIGRICDFLMEYHSMQFDVAEGKVDICELTDDFGTQNDLVIGIPMFQEYFEAQYRRFVKLIKSYDARVFHHDDGAMINLLPLLSDIGIEVLNPVQWHLPGMDLERLKSGYGHRICFHGGIDNQQVLPFGTVDDVRREVIHCVEVLASDRTGYILAPCHNVQVITPVENVVAMYDAGRACPW